MGPPDAAWQWREAEREALWHAARAEAERLYAARVERLRRAEQDLAAGRLLCLPSGLDPSLS